MTAADGGRRAVFFDRDGTLNADHGYIHRPQDWDWLPGAREAIAACNHAGVLVFVITNQSGVARGLFTEDHVRDLHDWVRADLRGTGAWIDDIRYCPHHPDYGTARYRWHCPCRKPAPGMILDLLSAWPVDPARSLVIGDGARDVQAGRAAGVGQTMQAAPGEVLGAVQRWLGLI